MVTRVGGKGSRHRHLPEFKREVRHRAELISARLIRPLWSVPCQPIAGERSGRTDQV